MQTCKHCNPSLNTDDHCDCYGKQNIIHVLKQMELDKAELNALFFIKEIRNLSEENQNKMYRFIDALHDGDYDTADEILIADGLPPTGKGRNEL